MIKEVIVVEGKDDIAAVKAAIKDAELIATSGFGITEKTIERIKNAQERCGVIVFTDPDFPGEKIRKIISERVPGCKHAFLPKEQAIKNGSVGIENASKESIISALSKVKTEVDKYRDEFTMEEIVADGLSGSDKAAMRRDEMGKLLGIGYGNSKQFLSRLNKYGISREEYEKALANIEK